MNDLISKQETVLKIVEDAIKAINCGNRTLTAEYNDALLSAVKLILEVKQEGN